MGKIFNSRLVFILILALITTGVVFIVMNKSHRSGQTNQPAAADQAVSLDKLKTDYEQSAEALLLPYFNWEKTTPLADEDIDLADLTAWQDLADKIKSQLLDLWVPEIYKDLHLQLVLGFDQLGRAMVDTSDDFYAAQQKITDLVAAYPWLNQ